MQKIFAFLLIAIALVSAQSRTVPTALTGSIISAITNPVSNPTTDKAPVLYYVWVPENTSYVKLTLENTNSNDCSYVDLLITSDGYPCVDETYGISNDNSFCQLNTNSYSGGSVTTRTFYVGYSSSYYFKAKTNAYMYIGVATEATYAAKICSYKLSVEVNQTCTNGQVAVQTASSDVQTCTAVTRVADANNYTLTLMNQTAAYAGQFSIDVPENTGRIHFHVESTSGLYVYGNENSAASYYISDCTASSTGSSGSFVLDLDCYTPEAGIFYFQVIPYSESANFNFTLTTSMKVCNGTTGGVNCTLSAIAANYTAGNTYNVAVPNSPSDDYYQFFYFDLPSSYPSFIQMNVALGNTTGDEYGYMIVTKDRYGSPNHYEVSDQSNGLDIGEQESWLFTFYDYLVPKRVFLTLYCTQGTTCNYTVSFNATGTNPSTTGSTGSTGTTTTGTATTTLSSTTNSATTMVAAIFVMLIALLF